MKYAEICREIIFRVFSENPCQVFFITFVDVSLNSYAIFNNSELSGYYHRILTNIKAYAADNDLVFAYSRPVLDERSVLCSENVCYSCVVNVEGEISPCVFTNPILTVGCDSRCETETKHIFKGRLSTLKEMSFGNIHQESLSRIWRKKEYMRFRTLFSSNNIAEDKAALGSLPKSCINCYKLLTPFL